jgi:hypothetical protein
VIQLQYLPPLSPRAPADPHGHPQTTGLQMEEAAATTSASHTAAQAARGCGAARATKKLRENAPAVAESRHAASLPQAHSKLATRPRVLGWETVLSENLTATYAIAPSLIPLGSFLPQRFTFRDAVSKVSAPFTIARTAA